MAVSYEDVKITPDPSDPGRNTYSHPAFSQIRVSRVSGSSTLYGSDFDHHHYIEIEILRSTRDRHLHHDWYFGGEPLLRVALSEAQWATFVSSHNMGSGTPCTLIRLNNQSVPQIRQEDTTEDVFHDEAVTQVKEIEAQLDLLRKRLNDPDLKLTKKQISALEGPVSKAQQHIKSNMPFLMRSMAEFMETKVEKAKVEIHAYAASALRAIGLEKLTRGPASTPVIEDRRDEGS